MFQWENRGTLLSLLGLLHPLEYIVTIDHSVLWQRHIAWSKPKGEELRQYVTQRYASNMVFLSCMLAAEINVFFNSSVELTDMRHLLQVGGRTAVLADGDTIVPHFNLRYWIGITLLIDACVTIMALVTTFTLWGMVSSISDANTHALLRSSIGQYVTSLPSRFTVGSLYLFLLWMIGFIINLVNGAIPCGIMVALVLAMFFQVVIPLSAFGRLIIHTGAMAKRPVLDEELEQELLPSGLHASLLIRATDRRRKYSCATDQYRKQNLKHYYTNSSAASSTTRTGTNHHRHPSGRSSHLDGNGFLPKNTNPSDHLSLIYPNNNKQYPSLPQSIATKQQQSMSYNQNQSNGIIPPRTITATILDEDEGMLRQPSRIRQDSDEITIDLEGMDEKEPLLSTEQQNTTFLQDKHRPTTPYGVDPHLTDSNSSSLMWNPDDEEAILDTTRFLEENGGIGGSTTFSSSPSFTRGHRRMLTTDSEFAFPIASVLNATQTRRELDDVVQEAIKNQMHGQNGSSVIVNGGPTVPQSINQAASTTSPAISSLNSSSFPTPPNGNNHNYDVDREDDTKTNQNDTTKDSSTNEETTAHDEFAVSPLGTDTATKETTSDTSLPPPPPPPPLSQGQQEEQRNTIDNEGSFVIRSSPRQGIPPTGRRSSWASSPKQQQQRKQMENPGSGWAQSHHPSSPRPQNQNQQLDTIDRHQQLLTQRHVQHSKQDSPIPTQGSSSQQTNQSSAPNIATNSGRLRPSHRRRSSAGRRSSASLLGFIASLSGGVDEEKEWQEENEVRAVFDALPSADLDSHDQIMEELENAEDLNLAYTSVPHPLKKSSPRSQQRHEHEQQAPATTPKYSPFTSTINAINQSQDNRNHPFDNSTGSIVYTTPIASVSSFESPRYATSRHPRTSSLVVSKKRRHHRHASLPPIIIPETSAADPSWTSPVNLAENKSVNVVANNETLPPQSQTHQGVLSPALHKSQMPRLNGSSVANRAHHGHGTPSPSTSSSQEQENLSTQQWSRNSQKHQSRVPKPRIAHRSLSQSDVDSRCQDESLTVSSTTTEPSPNKNAASTTNKQIMATSAPLPPMNGHLGNAEEGTHLLSTMTKHSNLPSYSASSK